MQNEGYTITSCPAGSAAVGICPYNGGYYSGCKSYEELCRQDNYYKSCSGGLVLDPDQSCGYDSSYKKCISSEEKCEEEGYHSSCEEGKILDPGQVCSYNSAYKNANAILVTVTPTVTTRRRNRVMSRTAKAARAAG